MSRRSVIDQLATDNKAVALQIFQGAQKDKSQSKDTYGEHVDKVNYVEMKHVSELAIIGLLLKPFKT